MKLSAAERFLTEFANWYIGEFRPPAGSTIGDAASVACAAVVLGADTVSFRFNAVLLIVTSKDTPEAVVNRYNAALTTKERT